MIHYIKFEFKNMLGYSIAMIVGGLLPLVLAIGGYHSSKNIADNYHLAITLFATLLPMIPLGLVILPFTISFGRDIASGITTRFNLFGYTLIKQMIAKFASVVILVIGVTIIYLMVLLNVLSFPNPSMMTIVNIFFGILLLTMSLYLIAFSIAQIFKEFSMIQGVAMVVYFGIAILTGTMGGFHLTGFPKMIGQFIPFEALRDNLISNWTTPCFSLSKEFIQLLIFLMFTIVLFIIVNLFRIHSRRR